MTGTKNIRTIWDSSPDFEDWREDLESEYPDYDEDELYQEMYRINDEYLDDERCNLDIELPYPILVVADLGLWNGRVHGIKMIGSNIKDCLYSDCDYAKWYVDEDGELCYEGCHHDGTNYYKYRVFTTDDYDEVYEKMGEKIYDGDSIEALIEKYTRPLGPDIAKVYGWEL